MLVVGFFASEIVKKEANEEKLAEVALLGADRVVHYLRKLITWFTVAMDASTNHKDTHSKFL